MKNFLLMISLCLFSVISNAKTYYVSPTGSDSNPGTLLLPFKNWEKLSNLMLAGDIAYIRGGTYLTPYTASKTTHCAIQNLTGTSINPIIIQNYPGEFPVFDLTNVGIPSASDPTALLINFCTYLRIKGLRITGLAQNRSGSGISRGFELWNSPNCTMERMEVDHIGGSGFMVQEASNDAYFLNCDAHHNDDRWSTNSDPWGGADGFDVTGNVSSTRTTFEGCRAWLNSDDGWDNYNTDGIRTWKNCWSFWNGYYQDAGMPTRLPAGNGEGFKLGPTHTDKTTVTLRFLQNCVAFENRDNGFDQNGTPTTLYQLYNNTAYKNGGDGFQFQYYPSTPINHVFKNNVAYSNSGLALRYAGANTNNVNNSWNGAVALSATDFQSVSSTGADGARQSDGSLPGITFMKLATGSDLINAGVNVGLPFLSTAPDMGAYEFGTPIIVPVTLIDFNAVERTGKTLLQWTTSTEINSSYFDVERSTDGQQTFEKIATVNANGNTNININYSVTDNYPSLGVNYYRLKIVDRDGSYEYSKIVSVNFKNNANTGSFEIKSAIVKNKTLQLNVSSSVQQPAAMSMYDAIGRVLFVSNITLQKGINNINKTITPSTGVYFFKLKTNDAMITLPLLNGQ